MYYSTSIRLINRRAKNYKKYHPLFYVPNFTRHFISKIDKDAVFLGWGYKKSGLEAKEMPKYLLLEDGFIRSVGLGVEGYPAFSIVEDEKGNRFLTRDGSFKIDSEGFLKTSSGFYVLGVGENRIRIENFSDIYVSEDGRIFSQGNEIGKILIVEQPVKRRIGYNLWVYDEKSAKISETSKVYQGFLEGSNVNVVYEMVKMIEAHREFDANLNVVKTGDELLASLNDFGRV